MEIRASVEASASLGVGEDLVGLTGRGVLGKGRLVAEAEPEAEHGQGEKDQEAGRQAKAERAIDALRELEFEYQTGKVSEEDYAKLRARYARQAIAARDELGETVGPGACTSCGAPRKEGAKFCSACGAQLA